jgi:pimeloyl-ACP methyl ester carboxylesterase
MPTYGGDEFAMLSENAADAGLEGPLPEVRRLAMNGLGALRWGAGDPEVVFLHGGAQNAHTWDTVIIALERPALAIDLPGHGHSAWRQDHDYSPRQLAAAVAPLVRTIAPDAKLVVGMSLGGLTAISLAATDPELVRRLAIIDVTPGANAEKAKAILAFTGGPATFPSFEAILRRTVEHNPARSLRSLERGVRHNARQSADGTWTWRYDPVRNWSGGARNPDFVDLWDDLAAVRCPVLLIRGGSSTVVDEEDIREFLSRQPRAQIETVAGAGHSIQGDRPRELAHLLDTFLKEDGHVD